MGCAYPKPSLREDSWTPNIYLKHPKTLLGGMTFVDFCDLSSACAANKFGVSECIAVPISHEYNLNSHMHL